MQTTFCMNKELQLSSEELKMMEEISQIFAKYSNRTREFEVHLVHSHFQIKKGETLYETHNKIKRELKIIPKKFTGRGKLPLATAWNTLNGKLCVAMFCCEGGGTDEGVDISNIPT